MFPFISYWDYLGQKMTHSVILERRSAVSDKKLNHRRTYSAKSASISSGCLSVVKTVHPSSPRLRCWRDISHRQRLRSLSSTTMIIEGGAVNYSVDGRSLFCWSVCFSGDKESEGKSCMWQREGQEGWSAHMPGMKVEIPVWHSSASQRVTRHCENFPLRGWCVGASEVLKVRGILQAWGRKKNLQILLRYKQRQDRTLKVPPKKYWNESFLRGDFFTSAKEPLRYPSS